MRSRAPLFLSILVGVWAVSAAFWITPGITRPDGVGYFAYLPSTWLDHDLLFFNEWQETGMIVDGRIAYKEVTGTGHLGNHWGPGSALYWYPAFVVADALHSGVPVLQTYPRNGFSLPYNVAVVYASALAGLMTVLLCFAAAGNVAPPGTAVLAGIGIWLGSPLAWYALKNSLTAHAVSALACGAVVLLSMRSRSTPSLWRVLGIGLATGFAVAVRPENVPIVLAPLILLDQPRLWRSIRAAGTFVAGGLIGIAPQLVVNAVLYGSPLPFLAHDPTAALPWAPFERVHLLAPLFSWYHGLVPWTPFLALGAVGFVFLWKDDRRLAAAAISVFSIVWLMNATLDRFFWGGFSFGQRRFDSCTIFFAAGAASLFKRLPRWLAVSATALTSLWTMSLFLAASSGLDLNRYYSPGELLSASRAAISRPSEWLRVFAWIPASARPAVVVTLISLLILTGVSFGIVFVLRRRERFWTVAAGSLLVAASILFLLCGANDSSRIARYSELIAANRPRGPGSAWNDTKLGLLREELSYLEKTGRTRDARVTAGEIAAATARTR